MGLSVGLAKFAFAFERGAPIKVTLDRSLGDDPTDWRFRHLSVTHRHLIAVAIRRLPAQQENARQWAAVNLVIQSIL
jgi:hypothetical protein